MAKLRLFLASLAQPGLLQIDHHLDQTLSLFYSPTLVQEDELPPISDDAHRDSRLDPPHHRLLCTGFLRQHIPVQPRFQTMAFQSVRDLYRSEQISLLQRGFQHHHQRADNRYTSACTQHDET